MAGRMGSLQSSVAMHKAQSSTDPIKLPGNMHPPHCLHGLPGTAQFSDFHHVSFCTTTRKQEPGSSEDRNTFWPQCTFILPAPRATWQRSSTAVPHWGPFSCLPQPSAPERSTHSTFLLPPPAEPPQQTTSDLWTLQLSLSSPA